jgi:cytidyltransferase-like protein
MEKESQNEIIARKVMVFGVFDTLHDGHYFFIDQAQKLAVQVFIVVAQDSSVRHYKQRDPENPEAARIARLQEVYPEAIVVLGDTVQNSWDVVKLYQPDIIALGYDQQSLAHGLRQAVHLFEEKPQLVTIPDHRGDELHSSLLRK